MRGYAALRAAIWSRHFRLAQPLGAGFSRQVGRNVTVRAEPLPQSAGLRGLAVGQEGKQHKYRRRAPGHDLALFSQSGRASSKGFPRTERRCGGCDHAGSLRRYPEKTGAAPALLRLKTDAEGDETAALPEVPTKAAIHEYVEIAHMFSSGGEPAFVHAVLDRLAGRLRGPGEPS